VLRLGVALRRYWRARNRGDEVLTLLMPVLNRPEARAEPEVFAAALLTAAHSARLVDLAMARQLGEQAVKLARQLDAGQVVKVAEVGEPEEGLPPGREAVELARQLGDDGLLGESLAGYLLCDVVIDPAHARPLFTEAIACTQRSGDHLIAYYLTNSAGCHALSAGDLPAARTYLQQAAQAMRASGEEGIDLSILAGWVLRQDNDPDGARSSFGAALRISRRNGDRPGIAVASLGLACLAADAGDWRQAAVLHGAAEAFLDRTGPPWETLEARYRRDSLDEVRAHLGQEQFEQAHTQGMTLGFDQALDLVSRTARLA